MFKQITTAQKKKSSEAKAIGQICLKESECVSPVIKFFLCTFEDNFQIILRYVNLYNMKLLLSFQENKSWFLHVNIIFL